MDISVQWMGLEQQICNPLELGEGIVERILAECPIPQLTEEWILAHNFGDHVCTASGVQDAIQKFHEEHESELTGKVYLCHQETSSNQPWSNFSGTFGRPEFRGIQTSEDGSKIPRFVKRYADFSCEAKPGTVSSQATELENYALRV